MKLSPVGTAELSPGLRPISANLFGMFFLQSSHKIVILRACDLLDLSCLPPIRLAVLQAPQSSRHPERSASQICRITKGFMARSRRACPERSRRNPGNASWRILLRAFRPQTTTEVKKVTNSEHDI